MGRSGGHFWKVSLWLLKDIVRLILDIGLDVTNHEKPTRVNIINELKPTQDQALDSACCTPKLQFENRMIKEKHGRAILTKKTYEPVTNYTKPIQNLYKTCKHLYTNIT